MRFLTIGPSAPLSALGRHDEIHAEPDQDRGERGIESKSGPENSRSVREFAHGGRGKWDRTEEEDNARHHEAQQCGASADATVVTAIFRAHPLGLRIKTGEILQGQT